MHLDLRNLDLNLLPVFDALYRLRSVTDAAGELATSPSALSHALARLREALGDDVFVRQGSRMQPTARAEQMAAPVARALRELADTLAQGERFDPATSERCFVFSATDYTAFALMPALMARLEQVAPAVRVRVIHAAQKIAIEELAAGRIDFAIGYSEEHEALPPGVEQFDWLQGDYVTIAAAHHPHIRRRLTLEQYLAARHVVVTPWHETRGAIDHVLDALALRRTVALHLPSVLAAPFIVGGGELLLTLPRRAATILRSATAVAVYPPPFAIAPYTVNVVCHGKAMRTPAHTWMRQQLLDIRPSK